MINKQFLITILNRLLTKSVESIETHPIYYSFLIILLYIIVTHYLVDNGLAFLLGFPPFDPPYQEVSHVN